jgi:hypothetical protein
VSIANLRAVAAKHSGKYAESYRLGLDVAAGIITPAQDPKALGQGYRDGLKLRAYRVNRGGKKTREQNAGSVRKYREKMRQTHKAVTRWVQKD